MNTPVLIPLGNGSIHDNDELRYLLRSLERNATDLGTVYLMTTYAPDWIRESDRLVVVPIEDRFEGGKDGALHYKTMETIRRYNIGTFTWTADDAAFLKPVTLSEIPVIHNHRHRSTFYQEVGNHWRQRVRATFEWARKRGVDLQYQFECHCPQTFDGQAILKGMEGVPWDQGIGLTIYTTWRIVTDTWHASESQTDLKWTFEVALNISTMSDEFLCSKPFLGYNNAGSDEVLKRLAKMFPEKSSYEK